MSANNDKLKAMFDRGPDFSKNLFTIKFAEHSNSYSYHGSSASLSGADKLSYKIEGFEVKQPAASTYKVNVMGRTVTKISSSVSLDKTANFEYRLDSNLDLFRSISKMYLESTYKFIEKLDFKSYDIFIIYHTPFNKEEDDTVRYFLFSNCRITGQDAIEYDKESAEPVKCRVTFAYDYVKDCEEGS